MNPRPLVVRITLLTLSLLPILSAQSARPRSAAQNTAVEVSMKNMMYHFTDSIAAHIIQMHGSLNPTRPGSIAVLNDKNSFTLYLASAEIAISCDTLAQVMNEDVFSAPDAPIKKLAITSKDGQLVIKGELHSKGDVPFESQGILTPTGDGRVRFHVEHVKAAHLPVKGVLDLLGLDIAKLINTKKVRGVSSDKNDLILNPQEITPPPRIRGNITAVKIEGNDIVQVFGTPGESGQSADLPGNYMSYHGGKLRFGKLTMDQSDLVLIDMDPQDAFDFFLDHYVEQLVAGYSKTTPEFGLRVYMRDYDKLKTGTSASR